MDNKIELFDYLGAPLGKLEFDELLLAGTWQGQANRIERIVDVNVRMSQSHCLLRGTEDHRSNEANSVQGVKVCVMSSPTWAIGCERH